MTINFLLNELPWYLLGIWTFYSLYVSYAYKTSVRNRWTNYYIFESIPSVFITLGLLGTFAGITYGLIYFDTDPEFIKTSITDLLDGLKNAFYTSLYGICGNLIFSKIVKYKMVRGIAVEPEYENELQELKNINANLIGMSDKIANQIDSAIVESLKGMVEDVNNTFKSFINELVEKNFDKLTEAINQLIEWQREYRLEIQSIKEAYESLVNKHKEFTETTYTWVDKLDEIAGQTSQLAMIIDEFKAITDDDSKFSKIITEVKESTANMQTTSKALEEHSNKLDEVRLAFIDSKNEISEWLEREDGVRDSTNALSHSLQELRKFEISTIEKLDEKFMKDLEATFKTFDSLIKEYILYLQTQINEKK
ncbi:coiled-coil domain-containing protein [Fulvivirga lutea]|uniref:MotA/TolQ/ExbB proton channel domain-containing protein n=1 Tax=Fulvivirga lutea TaxID=2810512 RepID=A0A974WE18_9BACT|nr:hypothetical protein [Fulvivirga lutea]QSE96554.1 hypothetical protein JR347_13215 [Fulvivirga lutea]